MADLVIEKVKKQFYAPDGSLGAAILIPSLKVLSGEALVLTGPSGSGKSTFLHMIGGLLKPDSGSIKYGTVEIANFSGSDGDGWRSRTLGYVFQNRNLLDSLTVIENILVAGYLQGRRDREKMKEEAKNWLAQAHLAGKGDFYPTSLSLGEKQRVATIRAIFKQPSLVCADEPTASLDRKNAAVLLAMLKTLCREKNTTLIISSHDNFVKEQFNRHYDLLEGEVEA